MKISAAKVTIFSVAEIKLHVPLYVKLPWRIQINFNNASVRLYGVTEHTICCLVHKSLLTRATFFPDNNSTVTHWRLIASSPQSKDTHNKTNFYS